MAQHIGLLLLTIAVNANLIQGLPQLCAKASWTIAGYNVFSELNGFIVVIAFMPLDCPTCDQQLQKLQQLHQKEHDIRILIVSPSDTFYDAGAEKRKKYPDLKFWIDSEFRSAWQQTQAVTLDHFIYDRCGRLAEVVRPPKSDLSRYSDLPNAITKTKRSPRCGRCQYDPSRMQQLPNSLHTNENSKVEPAAAGKSPLKITINEASRTTQTAYYPNRQRRPENGQQEKTQNHDQRNVAERPRERQLPYVNPYPGSNKRTLQRKPVSNRSNNDNNPNKNWLQNTDNRDVPVPQQPYTENEQYPSSPQLQSQSQQQPQSRRPVFKSPQSYPHQKPSDTSRFGQNDRHREQNDDYAGVVQTTKRPTQQRGGDFDADDVQQSLYYVGSEERINDEKSNSKGRTLAPMQTQISAPLNHQIPVTPPYHNNDMVFCDHITDERCYQEKKNHKGNTAWWKKCCSKGLYLTDVCVPGRCSNSTLHLCCAQRFLQARYKCCNDETQHAEHPTDSFSRCCYDSFIDPQDVCCPMPVAKSFWSSTAELCLPNVFVNLTEIELEGKVSDTERVIVKLSEDRSWEYKCTYGTAVMQFIYLPDVDQV